MSETTDRFDEALRRQLVAVGVLRPPRRWWREKSQGVWEDPRYTLEGTGRMTEAKGDG